MSYNKIILIGNLGANPEVREYQGQKVANFSLATNEKWKDKNGNLQSHTEWFRVSFWGATADVVEKYVKKGDQVYIEGRLRTREYTDSEGKIRTSLEVAGQSLQMLGGASKEGEKNTSPQPRPQNYTQNTAPTQANEPTQSFDSDDPEAEDLPF